MKLTIDMDTYEKKYNEALKWMRELYPRFPGAFKEEIEHYFPELRESESEDERIRKDLIYDIERLPMQGVLTHRPTSEYIAYLKKQEQKPAERKINEIIDAMNGEHEPGDIYSEDGRLIAKKDESEDERMIRKIEMFLSAYGADYFSNDEWREIENWLEKQKEQKPTEEQLHNLNEAIKGLRMDGCERMADSLHSLYNILTKEQKPVEWKLPDDFEEAVYKVANFISPFNSQEELRKVSHRFAEQLLDIAKKDLQKPADLPAGFYVTLPDGKKYYTKEMRCNGMNVKVVEPKPAEWNEDIIRKAVKEVGLTQHQIDWFKTNVFPPKPAWSEEDEQNYKVFCSIVHGTYVVETQETMDKLLAWLKSLRPGWKSSEDEERLINTSISFLKDFADKGYENAVECIDWLKSKLNGNSGK